MGMHGPFRYLMVGIACAILHAAAPAQMLQTPTRFYAGPGAGALANAVASPVVADFDNDGFLDALCGAIGSPPQGNLQMGVWRGTSTGLATPPIAVTLVGSPFTETLPVAAADLNGDGWQDFIFRDRTPSGQAAAAIRVAGPLWIFVVGAPLGTGSAGTNGRETFVVRSFDMDPEPELAMLRQVGFPVGSHLEYYDWNPAIGDFALASTTTFSPTGVLYLTITSGDFNGDGCVDLAVHDHPPYAAGLPPWAPAYPAKIYLLAGDCAGSFAPPLGVALPGGAFSGRFYYYAFASAGGDVDRDGFDDWVGIAYDLAAPPSVGAAYISRGSPAGFLTPTLSMFTGAPHWQNWNLVRAQLVDFDLDGYPELLGNYAFARLWPLGASTGVESACPGSTPAPYLFAGQGFGQEQTAADFDGDGDADIFHSGCDSCPNYFTAIATNRTIYRKGCGGPTPIIAVGTPYVGNAAYGISLAGAPPLTPAVLAVSYLPAYLPYSPCVVGVHTGWLLVPTLTGVGFVTTDANGAAAVPLALPALPTWLGAKFYAQWLVVDPLGPAVVGGVPFSLSDARRILLW